MTAPTAAPSPTALALPEQGSQLTSAQVLRGLHTVRTVLAPDLTDEELKLFALVASRSGLDPFAKQLYAVKRKGRVTFQTGIDGYRSIAARTGLYDGQDEPEFSPACGCGDKRPEGHPEFVTVRVYRKGVSRPIAATAYWHEYKPEQGQSGLQDAMWVRMPRVMIAKVAEALALRKAFPYDPTAGHGIGADLYTADEMAQADRGSALAAARPGLQERLTARREATQAGPPAEVEGEVRELPLEQPAGEALAAATPESSAFDDAGQPTFADQLAAHAIEADDETEASPADIKRVRAGAFAGIPTQVINAGIAAAFGPDAKAHPTAAQVRSIELAADSLGPEAFKTAWEALAAEGSAS